MRGNRSLSIKKITQAAIKIADKDGITGLSMRKLATKLKVEAMSLYNHVSNKEELYDHMVDYIYGCVIFDPSEEWRTAMTQRAHSVRAVIKRHPWSLSLLDSRKTPGHETLKHHDTVLACLLKSGFTLQQTGHAYSLIDAYLFGFMLQDKNLPFDDHDELLALAEQIKESMPPKLYPHLRMFTTEYVLKPGYSFDQEFNKGLEICLSGIANLLET